MTKNVLFEILDSSEKDLTWVGIEPESSRLPVRSADHSATRPFIFQNEYECNE